ncbi:MAG TPA: hypothetical protein VM802_02165 [Chitinophaga sp.]|uniref:1,4-beta-xylanase n=1 Tax=Chitinophaga sp. TaxID=1869181 RepID=UPI002C1A51A4|nr:1,4-beta-xylanase [Chitinophaga sp.]HVI43639.1 hypothetical protein [Chitinophaga sp.]
MKLLIHTYRKTCILLSTLFGIQLFFNPANYLQAQVWTPERANAWYEKQEWLRGANYVPATAINQLEMFQAETFDTATISKELMLAKSIGFNTLRVFLHDLLWAQDAKGFKNRLDIFLSICARNGIRPMLVFFDSCWDPFPHTGLQHAPVAGVHNSGWVQSPGVDLLRDTSRWPVLEKYVKDIVSTFGKDKRVLCWDMWNEADYPNPEFYHTLEPADKLEWVAKLLPLAFSWARSQHPDQPLTSGIWGIRPTWRKDLIHQLVKVQRLQIELSDIISFHAYEDSASFRKAITDLQTYHRPLICTEYMSRENDNTVFTMLPIAREYKVGMINWGFVDGKEQTKYSWTSWNKKDTSDPAIWHHVLFRKDHTPYKAAETEFIKSAGAR